MDLSSISLTYLMPCFLFSLEAFRMKWSRNELKSQSKSVLDGGLPVGNFVFLIQGRLFRGTEKP